MHNVPDCIACTKCLAMHFGIYTRGWNSDGVGGNKSVLYNWLEVNYYKRIVLLSLCGSAYIENLSEC